MRTIVKLCSVLLLSSTLGACSMSGIGDLFSSGNDYNQTQNSAYNYGASSACDYTPTCAGNYTVGQPAQTSVYNQYESGQATYNQGTYGHQLDGPSVQTQPRYVQPNYVQPSYTQQSYTQQGYIEGQTIPAYTAPTAAPRQGLRGPKQAKNSYFYGSLGAVLYDVDDDLYGIQARAGWQSESIFGVEAEGSLGLTDDNVVVDFGAGPVPASFEIDNQIAAFAVARVPVGSQFNILGRYGYHNTEFSSETNIAGTAFEDDFSLDGIAYGVGAEYAFSPKTSARIDYTRYDFEGPDAEAVSLAISRKF